MNTPPLPRQKLKKRKDATGFRVRRDAPPVEHKHPEAASPTPSVTAPGSAEPTSTQRARSAPPLPKRNKGQLFLAILFLSFFAGLFYTIYATFFQFKAYGIVSGRLIRVAAPWDGTVTSWQVRDGDLVNQGDVLAVIKNIDMEQRLEQLADELRYAQAKLDAEASKIRFNFSAKSDREQKALAEYLESQGALLSERSVLDDLERRLARSKKLRQSGNVSQQAHDELFYRCSGQKQKVSKLEKAVEVLKARTQISSAEDDARERQLDPLLVEIEQKRAERERLRARIDLGRIVAPASGRITMRNLLTGESIRQGDPLVQILEDNSAEAILYVPQGFTDEFQVGSSVYVLLDPFEQKVPCIVKRIHNQFQPSPASIDRFYQKNQHLLPVYISPLPEFREEFSKRIDGTVKLPYSWNEWVVDVWENVSEPFVSRSDIATEGNQVDIKDVSSERVPSELNLEESADVTERNQDPASLARQAGSQGN